MSAPGLRRTRTSTSVKNGGAPVNVESPAITERIKRPRSGKSSSRDPELPGTEAKAYHKRRRVLSDQEGTDESDLSDDEYIPVEEDLDAEGAAYEHRADCSDEDEDEDDDDDDGGGGEGEGEGEEDADEGEGNDGGRERGGDDDNDDGEGDDAAGAAANSTAPSGHGIQLAILRAIRELSKKFAQQSAPHVPPPGDDQSSAKAKPRGGKFSFGSQRKVVYMQMLALFAREVGQRGLRVDVDTCIDCAMDAMGFDKLDRRVRAQFMADCGPACTAIRSEVKCDFGKVGFRQLLVRHKLPPVLLPKTAAPYVRNQDSNPARCAIASPACMRSGG